MDSLPLTDIARCLDLPTSTVERWIRQGRIPIQRRGDVGLFDHKELTAWARDHKLEFAATSPRPVQSVESEEMVSLTDCIRRGGVHFGIRGSDTVRVLREAAAHTPLATSHRDHLTELMLQREELSSTGIGNGVAIPHPRSPLADLIAAPSVSVCFLEQPVDFAALDGSPVFVLFVILSPSVKTHLRILARLAYLLRNESFLELLSTRPAADDLLRAVDELQMSSAHQGD